MNENMPGHMPNIDELISQIRVHIVDIFHFEDMRPEDLDPDMPLFGEMTGLDSIDALELTLLLDKKYGIKITDSKTARKILFNVRTIAEYVHQHGKPAQS